MSSNQTSARDSPSDQHKEDENLERLKRLGMQCVSPGFGKMDDRMLSTIQLSRDIAKGQKEVIHKLSVRQTESVKIPDSGDEVVPKHVEQTNQDVKPSSLDSLEKDATKSRLKSLKRARVPPPLNIGSSTANSEEKLPSFAQSSNSHYMGAKSAPAHITRYPRGKSKVQYLGRASRAESQARKRPRVNPSWPPMMNPAFTPYGYYQHPQTATVPYHMGYGPFQNAYQAPYVMAPVPYAMIQTPFTDPSAAQTTLQQDFETYRSQNPGVGTRDLFGNNESRWAPIQVQPQSARDEFFGSRTQKPSRQMKRPFQKNEAVSDENENENENEKENENGNENEDDSDNEEADLAIEEGAEPTSTMTSRLANLTTLDGELRLHDDSFGFSFSLLEAATDKKMFMSICDKVWDEFQTLSKREG
ncbi:LAME_0H08746g1_1 [Lachancea meyersii CBS 8951]|uniref:LAME_0H08746g1_1 n=1 Tax=Lachancea meyersii CBS 8951 TaxID=1266667 RepID=A0A1G4KF88_9SACH|nr:LAME_0H08746g1_1 [Lachancea meyersii CBS 8951]